MSTHRLSVDRICCDGQCVQGRLCPLRRRPTLNGLTPRTELDAARDPFDWTDIPNLGELLDVEPMSDDEHERLRDWRPQSAARVKRFVLALATVAAIVAVCALFYARVPQ